MKKRLFLLPLILASLVACGAQDEQKSSDGGDVTSQQNDTSGTTSQQTGEHDGSSVEKAFTPDELVAFMSNYADKQVSTQEYYVKGEAGTSKYDSNHKSYEVFFKGHLSSDTAPVQIYSGVLSSSVTADYTAENAMAGAIIVVKGYLEKFGAKYEIPYLSAQYSPTKSAVSPTILSVEGGNPGTGGGDGGNTSANSIAGNNASETGTIPQGAQTLSFTFSDTTISGISGTSSSSPSASGVATVNGYEFNYVNCIKHAASQYISSGYLGLCTSASSSPASFANKTAIPGKIVKVEFTMPTESNPGSVSALAPFVIDFGTSALGTTSKTTGKTGGSGVTLAAYSTIEGSYFAISVVKGKTQDGTKDKWANGYIATMTVTYVA